MNRTLRFSRESRHRDDPSIGDAPDASLLRIYWLKKELESFLPGLARHYSPDELVNIVVSQLNAIERETLDALKNYAENKGDS